MTLLIENSFYRLRCKDSRGVLLTRSQMQKELRKGDFIWNRWARNATRKSVRVIAYDAGPTWSGAFFPGAQGTIAFNLHWNYQWGSVPQIFAHERGHQMGLWTNGRHPTGNRIMATGAPGLKRQLGHDEARWAVSRFGIGKHNYHPLVMHYHRQANKARKLYANYGARLREERSIARHLRNKNQKVGLTDDELVRLNVANRVINGCVDERSDLANRFCGWERTCGRELLSIARGYGAVHKTLLPDQYAHSVFMGDEGFLFREDPILTTEANDPIYCNCTMEGFTV